MVIKEMPEQVSCPHLQYVCEFPYSQTCKIEEGRTCAQCNHTGPNLWVCIHQGCLEIGCSEVYNDHSTLHFKNNNAHCIHMNLSTQRIWCYMCENEVFKPTPETTLERQTSGLSLGYEDTGDTTDSDDHAEEDNPRGLVGLQNIGNTCYMNAALQALSNTPALTGFFLDCSSFIELTGNENRKPGLARSYQRLVKDIWHRKTRGYVVPNHILYGIRNVHPMFRGYQQHDTQEFLRCFMDQLHEELKEAAPATPINTNGTMHSLDTDDLSSQSSSCPSPTPSQSEGEYETCDSGVSERSSLSDESPSNISSGCPGGSGGLIPSRSPSPQDRLRSKLTVINRSNIPASHILPKTTTRSIISDVFDGKLLSSVQCLTCDRVSNRVETFQDLSLPIPGRDHLAVLHQSHSHKNPQNQPSKQSGVTCTDAVYQINPEGWMWWIWGWLRSWFWGPSVTLHDCLAAFFSADELKGDNMYSCEKCRKLRNGVKYSRVLALPEVLCIHLKRFRHELMYSSKISSPVQFPLHGLDMRPYLHKECVSEVSTYELSAVICHHGTAGGGHYTSFAKHHPSELWFEFDDQFVTQVPPENVQNCEAYVLFYRKCSAHMNNVRLKAEELNDMYPLTEPKYYVSRQWLNRFNTCAEPGPIDNWALLCPHGGLPPPRAAVAQKLTIALPQPLWEYLYNEFGGGPPCTRLYECEVCKEAMEMLSKRQTSELETFMNLRQELQNMDTPTTTYAISMQWFRQWQAFVRGTSGAVGGMDQYPIVQAVPGPIDNRSIWGGANTVRPNSDYAQLTHDLWKFFYDIYGGGPEIILKSRNDDNVTNSASSQSEDAPLVQPTTDSNASLTATDTKSFPLQINNIDDPQNVKNDKDMTPVQLSQSLQSIPTTPDTIPKFVIPTRKPKSPRASTSVTECIKKNYKAANGKTLPNGDSDTNILHLKVTANEVNSETTSLGPKGLKQHSCSVTDHQMSPKDGMQNDSLIRVPKTENKNKKSPKDSGDQVVNN